MIMNNDNFLLLRQLLKPFSMVARHDFFKWIINKYEFFKHWQKGFPNLVFLFMRHFPILQSLLPKNICISPRNRDYYLNQNFCINLDKLSFFSPKQSKRGAESEKQSIINSQLEKYQNLLFSLNKFMHMSLTHTKEQAAFKNHLINENGLEKANVLRRASSQGYLSGLDSFSNNSASGLQDHISTQPQKNHLENLFDINFTENSSKFESELEHITATHPTHPKVTKSQKKKPEHLDKNYLHKDPGGSKSFFAQATEDKHKSESMKSAHAFTKENNEVHFSRHNINVVYGFRPIFSKISNMLTIPRLRSPLQSPSKFIASFLKLTQTDQEKAHLSNEDRFKTSWSESLLDEKESKIIPLDTRKALFHSTTDITSDKEAGNNKETFNTMIRDLDTSLEHLKMGASGRHISAASMPALHYANPLNVSLDNLKKGVSDIDRRITESEKSIEKSISVISPPSSDTSYTPSKSNLNLNDLSEQLYQMLERKIVIERERRGL